MQVPLWLVSLCKVKWSELPNKSSEFPQLWFARVEESSVQQEQTCKRLLSISEYKRFKLIKSTFKQRQYLLSRWLIRYALSNAYNQPVDYWNIEEKAGKFPVIHNLPVTTYLSLSHSHDRVVVTISNSAIGVDIEKIVPRNNMAAMAELFMSPDELELFHQHANPALYFYQTWCIKEAYFKSMSSIEQQNVTLRKIDSTLICSEEKGGMVVKTLLAEYMLAVYGEKNQRTIQCYALNEHDAAYAAFNNNDKLTFNYLEVVL